MTMRASPIQDMPTDRVTSSSGQSDMPSYTSTRRYDESAQPNYVQPTSSQPLMSIATPVSPLPTLQSKTALKSSPPIPQREETPSQRGGDERLSNSQFSVRELSSESTIETKSSKRLAREERSFESNDSKVIILAIFLRPASKTQLTRESQGRYYYNPGFKDPGTIMSRARSYT